MTYSFDQGQVVVSTVETPRNTFHYCKKSNKTGVKNPKEAAAISEEANGEALAILNQADITALISTPTDRANMANHIIGHLDTARHTIEWTDDEKRQIDQAIKRLEGIKDDEEESNDLEPEEI